MKYSGFILCLLLACSCSRVEINEKKEPATSNNYDIAVHDTITLTLDSNPTTGYSWNWLNQNSVSIVTSAGSQYIMDKPEDKKIAGRGGKEIWRFVGVKSGSDTIKLGYRRPWESAEPVKTMVVSVKVR